MKKICFSLLSVLLFAAVPRAADLSSMGDWSETINATNLIAGAGSDLTSQYESTTGTTTLTISSVPGSWHVKVRRSDATWHLNFTLWVKRTSDGSGSGAISGGTSYVEASSMDTEIFSGSGERSNITLQYKLTGMSKNVSPSNYSASAIFTVVE
jgi:hypothetical protein